jgi:hypothetical protein
MLDFYEEKRSLAQEILKKADLGCIAEHIEEIEEFNLIGSSPKTFFNGLSIKILMCLNTEQGIWILKDEHTRNQLPEFFRKAPAIFQSPWNLCQCLFWLDVSSYYKTVKFCKEIVEILKMLKRFQHKTDYEKYKEYYLTREEIGKRIQLPLIPAEDEFLEMIEKANYILKCLLHEEDWNHLLYQRYAHYRSYFEYQDEKFDVVILKNLQEFWEESEKQSNCVWGSSYVKGMADGEKIILSLRRRGQIKVPYVTIEIETSCEGFTIKQAKGKYNFEVEDDTKEWILQYCDDRGIEIHRECKDLSLDPIEKERRNQQWQDWCFYLLG